MTPEERLASAVSAARRIAPSDSAAQRLAEKMTTLGPPAMVASKLPLLFKIGVPVAIGVAALVWWRQSQRHVDAPLPSPQPSVVMTAPAITAPHVTTAPDNAVSVDDLPIVKAPPSTHPKLEPKADPNAELTLISRAESTLSSDPAGALALTEEHRAKSPNGQLVPERAVIAVEALAKLGRKTEAQQRADQFLARHADSPYRVRLERALR